MQPRWPQRLLREPRISPGRKNLTGNRPGSTARFATAPASTSRLCSGSFANADYRIRTDRNFSGMPGLTRPTRVGRQVGNVRLSNRSNGPVDRNPVDSISMGMASCHLRKRLREGLTAMRWIGNRTLNQMDGRPQSRRLNNRLLFTIKKNTGPGHRAGPVILRYQSTVIRGNSCSPALPCSR